MEHGSAETERVVPSHPPSPHQPSHPHTPQYQEVLHHLLAEVVVDAVNLLLQEEAAEVLGKLG